MRVLIDGDAFPNINEIISVCKKYLKGVIIYVDTSHVINDSYAKVVVTSVSNNAVDLLIENELQCGDLVLTGDYGIAVIALSKKAYVLNQYGYFYDEASIDYLMEIKAKNIKLRKHYNVKGPKKRSVIDKERLLKNIISVIGSD